MDSLHFEKNIFQFKVCSFVSNVINTNPSRLMLQKPEH